MGAGASSHLKKLHREILEEAVKRKDEDEDFLNDPEVAIVLKQQVDDCLRCVNLLNEKLEGGADPFSPEIKDGVGALCEILSTPSPVKSFGKSPGRSIANNFEDDVDPARVLNFNSVESSTATIDTAHEVPVAAVEHASTVSEVTEAHQTPVSQETSPQENLPALTPATTISTTAAEPERNQETETKAHGSASSEADGEISVNRTSECDVAESLTTNKKGTSQERQEDTPSESSAGQHKSDEQSIMAPLAVDDAPAVQTQTAQSAEEVNGQFTTSDNQTISVEVTNQTEAPAGTGVETMVQSVAPVELAAAAGDVVAEGIQEANDSDARGEKVMVDNEQVPQADVKDAPMGMAATSPAADGGAEGENVAIHSNVSQHETAQLTVDDDKDPSATGAVSSVALEEDKSQNNTEAITSLPEKSEADTSLSADPSSRDPDELGQECAAGKDVIKNDEAQLTTDGNRRESPQKLVEDLVREGSEVVCRLPEDIAIDLMSELDSSSPVAQVLRQSAIFLGSASHEAQASDGNESPTNKMEKDSEVMDLIREGCEVLERIGEDLANDLMKDLQGARGSPVLTVIRNASPTLLINQDHDQVMTKDEVGPIVPFPPDTRPSAIPHDTSPAPGPDQGSASQAVSTEGPRSPTPATNTRALPSPVYDGVATSNPSRQGPDPNNDSYEEEREKELQMMALRLETAYAELEEQKKTFEATLAQVKVLKESQERVRETEEKLRAREREVELTELQLKSAQMQLQQERAAHIEALEKWAAEMRDRQAANDIARLLPALPSQ